MKRLIAAVALATTVGCATTTDFFGPQTITLKAGESYCSSSDPKVCAELFAMMAPLMTKEMDAIIKRAQCEAQKELC